MGGRCRQGRSLPIGGHRRTAAHLLEDSRRWWRRDGFLRMAVGDRGAAEQVEWGANSTRCGRAGKPDSVPRVSRRARSGEERREGVGAWTLIIDRGRATPVEDEEGDDRRWLNQRRRWQRFGDRLLEMTTPVAVLG